MNVDYQHDDDCLVVRVAGTISLHDARRVALDAIAATREEHMQRLLLDFLGAEVIPLPSLTERFEIVHEWAAAAAEPFALAIVGPEEMFDPDRIGLIMASRLGLRAHVFEDAVDALLWVKRHRVVGVSLRDRPLYH